MPLTKDTVVCLLSFSQDADLVPVTCRDAGCVVAPVPEDVWIQCCGHVCRGSGGPPVLPAGSGEWNINSCFHRTDHVSVTSVVLYTHLFLAVWLFKSLLLADEHGIYIFTRQFEAMLILSDVYLSDYSRGPTEARWAANWASWIQTASECCSPAAEGGLKMGERWRHNPLVTSQIVGAECCFLSTGRRLKFSCSSADDGFLLRTQKTFSHPVKYEEFVIFCWITNNKTV